MMTLRSPLARPVWGATKPRVPFGLAEARRPRAVQREGWEETGMINRRRWLAAFAALTLAVLAAGTALGYAGEIAYSVVVSGPSATIKCNTNVTVTATVRDKNNKLIAAQPVTWSWVSRVSGKDVINTIHSTTNAKGVAKTTVNLACVPGSRRIRAKADDVHNGTVLNVTAAGLPRTSTLAPSMPAPAEPLLGTLLALLALAGGGGLALRGALARR
jgi:hypothetical protein